MRYSLLLGTKASTKPDFCYLLTLNVKNTVHLGDGDTWLQLLETFQLFELTFIRGTAYGEPARGIVLATKHYFFKAA